MNGEPLLSAATSGATAPPCSSAGRRSPAEQLSKLCSARVASTLASSHAPLRKATKGGTTLVSKSLLTHTEPFVKRRPVRLKAARRRSQGADWRCCRWQGASAPPPPRPNGQCLMLTTNHSRLSTSAALTLTESLSAELTRHMRRGIAPALARQLSASARPQAPPCSRESRATANVAVSLTCRTGGSSQLMRS